MNLKEELNESQRLAVEYNEGPSLVIAGAGSGKTRVLTYKIAYLLELGMKPWNILALTFTNKAAREMKERIGRLVGAESARYLYMGTFHSIFSRILRVEAEHIGYTGNFTIYDDGDSRSLVKAIIKEMNLDEKVYKPSTVHNRISMAKNHLILAHEYAQHRELVERDILQKMPAMPQIFLQSYEDHCKFLRNGQRYRSLFSLPITDYKGWANGLKAAGYATNPRYASQLIGIIELYKLYQYDNAKSYDKFMAKRSGTDQPVGGNGQLHSIHIYNKNYYLYARQGDTFKMIGKEIGISYKKIARYNERDSKDPLVPGEIIWLKKKQKRADKEFKNRPHIVRAGESMYSIAQYYGIRLKSLYKMNGISPDESIRVGQRLKVR